MTNVQYYVSELRRVYLMFTMEVCMQPGTVYLFRYATHPTVRACVGSWKYSLVLCNGS